MRLELKHLAPYLPYRLIGIIDNPEYYPTTKGELLRLDTSRDGDGIPVCVVGEYEDELKYFKPILRLLSDLTKEIEHNGERFVPKDFLWKGCDTNNDHEWIDHCIDLNWKDIDWMIAPYWMVQKLFEWHFDVFGLIDAGLAIEINTLEYE